MKQIKTGRQPKKGRIHVIIQMRLTDWPTESCSDHFWSPDDLSLSSWLEIRRGAKFLISSPCICSSHWTEPHGFTPHRVFESDYQRAGALYCCHTPSMTCLSGLSLPGKSNTLIWKTGKSRISLMSLEICIKRGNLILVLFSDSLF